MSRPWLTTGIVSAAVICVGFTLLTLAPQADFPIFIFLLLVGFPGLAISLIRGGAGMARRRGIGSKMVAAAMLLLAVPVGLYALLLILSMLGVIHLM